MKRLYRKVLKHANGEPATAAAIALAEKTLGAPLSKSFKRFASEVGAASWPVDIAGPSALARYADDDDRPSFLVPFASDGGGNDWCFDLRTTTKGEYPIVYWDHEEPPSASELAEPGQASSFDAWLEGLVADRSDEDEEHSLDERRERIEAALSRHRETNTWPWAPSEEDVNEVEATLGKKLPKDYVWFTTTFGSTPWPLAIRDATELGKLTAEMEQRFPRSSRDAIAFGHEEDGAIVAFRKQRIVVLSTGEPRLTNDGSFLDFLERRIAEGTAPEPDAPPAPPAPAGPTYRISDDTRTNDLWCAVVNGKSHSMSAMPDGRVQIAIDVHEGGKRRSFTTPEVWAVIERHLAEWAKARG